MGGAEVHESLPVGLETHGSPAKSSSQKGVPSSWRLITWESSLYQKYIYIYSDDQAVVKLEFLQWFIHGICLVFVRASLCFALIAPIHGISMDYPRITNCSKPWIMIIPSWLARPSQLGLNMW